MVGVKMSAVTQPRSSGPIRVGIVGLGFGRYHAAVLARMPGVEVAALCQAHESDPPLRVIAEAYQARVYRDVATMLSERQLDLVCVCTRPSSHLEVTRAAIDAGAAVLIEKPLAANLAESQALWELVTQTEAWATVNFEMRYHPPIQRLRELLAEGHLDRPLLLELTYVTEAPPPGSWITESREGKGPIWENTCHSFDLARYLLGDLQIRNTLAANLSSPTGSHPDGVIVTMQNEHGALVNLVGGTFGTTEREVPMRLDLYGSNGHATVLGSHHMFTAITYAHSGGPSVTERFPGPSPVEGSGPFAVKPVLQPGLERVVRELQNGQAPSTSVEDALEAAVLIDKALS